MKLLIGSLVLSCFTLQWISVRVQTNRGGLGTRLATTTQHLSNVLYTCIMWHHVTLCDIMWHHVISCDIMWHHVTSCDRWPTWVWWWGPGRQSPFLSASSPRQVSPPVVSAQQHICNTNSLIKCLCDKEKREIALLPASHMPSFQHL